jgi:formamidopyrimidine-DNA glycosylase
MPELPEVETVRAGLEPVLAGRRLARVEARRPDLRFPLPDGFVQRLTGAQVLKLRRRAKYLLADLDRGGALLMHLGMTGRFEVEGAHLRDGFALAAPADARHAHVLFETDEGTRITFYDARRFGFMDLVDDDDPRILALGPEPLGADFDGAVLARAFDGRRQGPKTLLLDQRVVAGLGNIYVCEALHRAKISPTRPAGAISAHRLERLAAVIKEVLGEAIEAGGSTLRDFAAADGGLGYFQHHFGVYEREGEPCPNPGCRGTIGRIVQAGRSTYFCPTCQR